MAIAQVALVGITTIGLSGDPPHRQGFGNGAGENQYALASTEQNEPGLMLDHVIAG